MREAETEPDVSLYLDVNQNDYWNIELVLKNSGRGMAHNLKLDFDDVRFPVPTSIVLLDGSRELHMLSDISILRGLSSLAPGQEFRCHFLEVTAATEKFNCKVNLGYKSHHGKRYKQEWVLDMAPFIRAKTNMTQLHWIRYALEDIKNILAGGAGRANQLNGFLDEQLLHATSEIGHT